MDCSSLQVERLLEKFKHIEPAFQQVKDVVNNIKELFDYIRIKIDRCYGLPLTSVPAEVKCLVKRVESIGDYFKIKEVGYCFDKSHSSTYV
jgi:hypothetical protein